MRNLSKTSLGRNRALFLDMAGLHVDAYKSLLRRDQVPLRSEADTEYNAVQAVVLGFADALANNSGYGRTPIKASLEARVDLCTKAIRDTEAGLEAFALFFHIDGVGRVARDEDVPYWTEVPSFAAVGSMEQIADQLLTLSKSRQRPLLSASILNFGAVVDRASAKFKSATGITISGAME